MIKAKVKDIIGRITGRHVTDMHLALELTDFCNCNCIMCSQSAVKVIHGSKKGFIEDSLVKQLILDLEAGNWKIHKFLPFALGESLLHPNFAEIMRFVLDRNRKSRTFQTVDLHTNAILLEGDNARVLLDYADQIDTLSFSLDAVNPDTYKIIRRNPLLETAEKNVETFIRERKRRGLNRPRLHFQFIVMEENEAEAEQFLERWQGFLEREGLACQVNYDWYPPMRKDTIFFKRLNPFRNSDIAAAEALHRQVAVRLGLVDRELQPSERIIRSNEYVNGKAEQGSASGASGHGHFALPPGDSASAAPQPEPVSPENSSKPAAPVSPEDFSKPAAPAPPGDSSESTAPVPPEDSSQWADRRPCSGPWKFINVSWDGEVTVCCIDTGRELSIGNLHNKGIDELWNTGLVEDYRLWQIRGEFWRMPKCVICRNLDSPMITDDEVIQYLKSRELHDDIEHYRRRFNL